jgi:hypothetical protein
MVQPRSIRRCRKRLTSPDNRYLTREYLQDSIESVPTLSFHVPPGLEQKVRKAAKQRGVPVSRFLKETLEKELQRQSTSFGELARRVAGIVNSGQGDLSMREGFDD